MKYIGTVVVGISVSFSLPAQAVGVYAGCAIPTLKTGHHTFYVDPVNGSTSGDGSATKPWKTLAGVLDPAKKLIATQQHSSSFNKGTDTALHAVNATAPVKAGDLILLKSGDHGSIQITNMFNADFITIEAAPGATPVIDRLSVVSSAKWMFQGLTFQGMAATATGAKTVTPSNQSLVTTGRGDWIGATSDVVFANDTFQTAASTQGWSAADWINKPYSYGLFMSAPCTSAVSSHFTNVLNGIVASVDKALIQGNTIDHFSNDGMDLVAGNLLVKNNTIKDGVNTTTDPFHADGIQGWSNTVNGTPVTNMNVVIDGNILTKTGDTNTTYLQGISIFDGKWDGLVIQNNVVNVNHWNSVAVYGAKNSKILNNTVVASDPTGHPSWIQVHAAKDGTASSNVLVRNNIATQFDIASGAAFDHNIAASSITTYPNGTKAITRSGNVGTANSVNPAVLTSFATLNTSAGTFDMRLRSTSPAVGFGTLTGAPPLDILGKTRTSPVDVGAYNH